MAVGRFARVFIRDFGIALLFASCILLFAPGPWDAKVFAIGVTLVLALLATLVEVRRKKPQLAILPTADETIQRGLAAFPTSGRLRSQGVVLGAFASGPHQGRHFVLGLAADGSTWWGVQPRTERDTTIWADGVPHHEARGTFEGWEARFLADDKYAHQVLGVYFPELLSVLRQN
jgi:hypothetical protein